MTVREPVSTTCSIFIFAVFIEWSQLHLNRAAFLIPTTTRDGIPNALHAGILRGGCNPFPSSGDKVGSDNVGLNSLRRLCVRLPQTTAKHCNEGLSTLMGISFDFVTNNCDRLSREARLAANEAMPTVFTE